MKDLQYFEDRVVARLDEAEEVENDEFYNQFETVGLVVHDEDEESCVSDERAEEIDQAEQELDNQLLFWF